LLAKAQELSSLDSQELEYPYSSASQSQGNGYGYGNRTSEETSLSLSVQSSYQGKPLEDLKESLLRDMGTTRNINQLSQINKQTSKWIREQKRLEAARGCYRRGAAAAAGGAAGAAAGGGGGGGSGVLKSPYSLQTHSTSGRYLTSVFSFFDFVNSLCE
jgi:hypothetical protein